MDRDPDASRQAPRHLKARITGTRTINLRMDVMPANAGIHFRFLHQSNMDARVRRHDVHESYER